MICLSDIGHISLTQRQLGQHYRQGGSHLKIQIKKSQTWQQYTGEDRTYKMMSPLHCHES